LKGVGPRKAADLKRAGLVTVEDLLYRLPFRYEDRSRMQPISSLRPGTKAAVLGEIKTANVSITRRRGFRIFHAVIADASGSIRCTWMNQAFLADILNLPVERPQYLETTALGAAFLAGLATGVWDGLPALESTWKQRDQFTPKMAEERRSMLIAGWRAAVARTLSKR